MLKDMYLLVTLITFVFCVLFRFMHEAWMRQQDHLQCTNG